MAGTRTSGPGPGRKKIYDDPAHKNLRDRVKRYRQKHAAKLAAEVEQRRIARALNHVPKFESGFLVWEIVNAEGQIVRVIRRDIRHGPPRNGQRSIFLPSVPVNRALASAIRDARKRQLEQWRNGG